MSGFDPNDDDVAWLMSERGIDQARELGAPMVSASPKYRVTNDLHEMRRRHREQFDPLGLDDEPDRRPFVLRGHSRDGVIVMAADGPLLKAFLDCATEIVQFVERNAEAIAKAIAAAGDEFDKLNRRQRTRHGHASVCPRHGPTRGGLCRRCAR